MQHSYWGLLEDNVVDVFEIFIIKKMYSDLKNVNILHFYTIHL